MFWFLREKPRAQGSIWSIGTSVLLLTPDPSTKPPGRESRFQQHQEGQEERSLQPGAFPKPSGPFPGNSVQAEPLPAPSPGSAAGLGERNEPGGLQGGSRASTGTLQSIPSAALTGQLSWARSRGSNPCPPFPSGAVPQFLPHSRTQGWDPAQGEMVKNTQKRTKSMQEYTANTCVHMMLNTNLFFMVTHMKGQKGIKKEHSVLEEINLDLGDNDTGNHYSSSFLVSSFSCYILCQTVTLILDIV